MICDDVRIDAAQRKPADQTVCRDEAVERIACPSQVEGLLNECDIRCLVEDEARISHNAACEVPCKFNAPRLGKNLNFRAARSETRPTESNRPTRETASSDEPSQAPKSENGCP